MLSCSASGGEGPTWAEAIAETPQRKIITGEQAPTWEEMTGDPLQKKVTSDRGESDWDDDTCTPVESQFEDATTSETCMDMVEEPTVDSPQEENVLEALVGPESQDVGHKWKQCKACIPQPFPLANNQLSNLRW